MNMPEEVRKFVEGECKKPGSKYGYEPYTNHFVPMVNYAKVLAEKLGADLEIVELSSWLHDVGSIVYGRENHHVTSSEIAERKLRELGCSEDKIERVKHCILAHRGSLGVERETKEAQIVADADTISAFDHIEGQFHAAFVSEKKNQQEARESVRAKLKNCYNKISPEAREMIRHKYEAAMLLLG
jgi:uncharacterized protein